MYGGKCYMGFVGNLLGFPAVKEFWKSVKNWQSYCHEFGVQLFLAHPVWCIERRHFQWPWTNPTPVSRSRHFSRWMSQKCTIYRHSFNEMLIGTYTCPTQQCRFKWSRVTLSDLAKYFMTRSVARSLCDSWASCYFGDRLHIFKTN